MINENKSSYYPEIYPYKKGVYSPYNPLPTIRLKIENLELKLNTKIMKKTFTILLLALTMIGCSSNDDIADNSITIIGKWTLESQFSSDGINENIDDCQQRSNITFKTDNTFDLNSYRTINGDCALEDEDRNVEYKVENEILEITRSYIDNGQTIIETDKIKIEFPNNNTLEIYGINQDGTTSTNPRDIWIRVN